ncbi:isoform 3 of ankyrin-3 [Aspergillus udagawae]|nr:isoform 3 of ankyrin-3 [Aspergillus udagawae]
MPLEIRPVLAERTSQRTSVYPAVQEVGVQKNLTDEDWKFVAHRREKRKREGKDAGDVRVHGNLIPEPKVRKETARHASLLSQCLSLGDSDPKTPEGVVVGTPRSEIDGTVSDDSANVLAMDWCQGLSVDSINVVSPTLFQSAERDHRLSVSTSASTSNLLASVAAVGDVEICRILIEAGADLNASSGPTGWRTTALHRASENNNVECVRVLLEAGADPNPAVDGRHHYTLHALDQEIEECNWGSDNTPALFTPLQAAVRAQNITMIRMLLGAGAQIDGRPRGKYGHTALQICAMIGNERIIEILLRKGADINAPAGVYRGRTALQAASIHSDTTVLSILLRQGADVDAPPALRKGKTALQIAVAAGNLEGVRILLDANAAVNTDPIHTEGVTALQEAIQIRDSAIRNEIVHLLLRAGANTDGLKDWKEYAPLHAAVRQGDLEMTRKLLEKGANANV